jgi:hypothetical protein
MAKYIFSQGTIRVEYGTYGPILNKAKDAEQGAVLLIVLQPPHPKSEADTKDEGGRQPRTAK